jgi:maltose alpha-D-glucosyltransferase/alpha-amylase
MADSDWYKDAVLYEVRVPSFYDSDGDGTGDLRGLIEKLDYLKVLGVTALWLLPHYPSPQLDDGYDIADYYRVNPALGNLEDFKRLLDEAHARDLRVVTELVLNHTSDAHPWFQRARRAAPGSVERNFYVWSDTPDKWADARVIFRDFEKSNWSWDPVARAYFWHRFYAHQPDLNFESPAVHEAMLAVVDHWFALGVDGLRLDAVPYLYEREGTTCENLPETHAFLKKLRAHVDRKFPNRLLLAEANQWPEDAAAYFGAGDECHMAFHFPIMPRLFMALRMEDSYPIADILEQTPAIPPGCQWAVFLRNHDELTLEMVTEEERDYMVRFYASDRQTRINLGIRRRLAPLLDNDRRRIELLNAILFAIPGTPVLYYGDEIGMGDNAYLGDRNGVRTPMQWSADRNGGFSRANPQRLVLPLIIDPEFRYETVNVEVQENNPSSLLWWMKRALALRKRHAAFARGTLTLLAPENRKVLVFLREHAGESLLVVANLSRAPQWVELDLRAFRGTKPVELFGNVAFPPVGDEPYLITLGAHDVFWLALSGSEAAPAELARPWEPRSVPFSQPLDAAFRAGSVLESALVAYIPGRRWFQSKSRAVTGVRLVDSIVLPAPAAGIRLIFAQVSFAEGEPETYVLPISAQESTEAPARAVLGLRRSSGPETWLVDVADDGRTGRALHELAQAGTRAAGARFEIAGVRTSALEPKADAPVPSTRVLGEEQTNTSYVNGQEYVGKLLRRLEDGTSLEVEILEHLARAPEPPPVAKLLGRIDVELGGNRVATLFLSETYLMNEGGAWQLTVDAIQRFFDGMLTSQRFDPGPRLGRELVAAALAPEPPEVRDLFDYRPFAHLLGQRTAELHLALAHDPTHPSFGPQRFTDLARRSAYQSLRNLTARCLDRLRQASLSDTARELAEQVLDRAAELRERSASLLRVASAGRLIRAHGDYHLGQVLYTGRDFAFVDFDGEPGRGRAERQRLLSPLADVAGMLRSFHYAALGVLSGKLPGSRVREEDRAALLPFALYHYDWSAAVFLAAYLERMSGSGLLPDQPAALQTLLDVHLIEKALYEVHYELGFRPDWVELPLRGLLDVLG